MKKAAYLVLILSVIANAYQYRVSKKPKIAALSDTAPVFTSYPDSSSQVVASGYVKWNDPSKTPENIRQYWRISIQSVNQKNTCNVLDVWEWSGSGMVAIDSPAECYVLEKKSDVVLVKYHDSIITITKNDITISSKDAKESGGARLVSAHNLMK